MSVNEAFCSAHPTHASHINSNLLFTYSTTMRVVARSMQRTVIPCGIVRGTTAYHLIDTACYKENRWVRYRSMPEQGGCAAQLGVTMCIH